MRLFRTSLFLLSLALAACSGSTTSQQFGPPANSGSGGIAASAGGSVADSRDDRVVVSAGALASDQVISVSYDPNATQTPPNRNWNVAHGVLSVSLPGGTASSTSAKTAVQVYMVYGASEASAIETAAAPLVTLTSGTTSRRVVISGTFDAQAHAVTIAIPASMISGVTTITVALGENAPTLQAVQLGGKLWTPSSVGGNWYPFNLWSTSARTLIVIHGIFSSVESAYVCANHYLAYTANGDSHAPYAYQQIIGFDYDFAQPPNVEGPKFAQFVNSLSLTNYDIEAHSYGTLVTLAALPQLTTQPHRTVLAAGPLPLRGTPIALPGNTLLRNVLMSIAEETISSPQQIDEAINSGMVASLATNSTALQTLLSGIKAMPQYPVFERVAGTQEYELEIPFNQFLIDAGINVNAFDGVVEVQAAESADMTATRQIAIPYSHMGLPCDQPTIDFVTQSL